MRKKENKLVITFKTTADAMAMEQICRDEGIGGRLIPLPKSIDAGCGLAWCVMPDYREMLSEFIKQHHVVYEQMCLCLI